jgi:hypothetical protein
MSKFKDQNGNFYTQSLFLELAYDNPKHAIYTLKDDDHEFKGKDYKSIKKLYVATGDPTEYKFATEYLGGWNHWKRLLNKTSLLHPYIEEWREELEVKMRSAGVARMISNSYDSPTAAKWLAEKGWTDKRTAGRPSKAEVEGEKKQQASVKSVIQSDLDRLKNVRH